MGDSSQLWKIRTLRKVDRIGVPPGPCIYIVVYDNGERFDFEDGPDEDMVLTDYGSPNLESLMAARDDALAYRDSHK